MGASKGEVGLVGRIAQGSDSGSHADGRELGGPGVADQRPRRAEAGLCGLQILVRHGDLSFQSVELLIRKEFPPIGAQPVGARVRGYPDTGVLVCLRERLLVRGCERCLWPEIVRTDGAACEQQRCSGEEQRFVTHKAYSDFESATRTTVPLIRESDGSTMTSSAGCKPERISTFSP